MKSMECVLDFPSLEVWSILKSLTNVLAELLQANPQNINNINECISFN